MTLDDAWFCLSLIVRYGSSASMHRLYECCVNAVYGLRYVTEMHSLSKASSSASNEGTDELDRERMIVTNQAIKLRKELKYKQPIVKLFQATWFDLKNRKMWVVRWQTICIKRKDKVIRENLCVKQNNNGAICFDAMKNCWTHPYESSSGFYWTLLQW